QAGEADVALLGSAHARQRIRLDVLEIRYEALAADDPAGAQLQPRALGELVLRQVEIAVAGHDLEREAGGREEHARAALADPQGPAAAARDEQGADRSLVDPGGRKR